METVTPPLFPARPINGGPLPKALPKRGAWIYEPKINGWRAWVHRPTGAMFNRENKPLSITHEFKAVLDLLKTASDAPEWLDVEALERRLPIGKGTLVILDAPIPGTLSERQGVLYDTLKTVTTAWAFEHFEPPSNELLFFAYHYSDQVGQIAESARVKNLHSGEQFVDPDLLPANAWSRLRQINKALKCELFEGLVAKRIDSTYPVQLRSPDVEYPYWMKHRWNF